MDLVSLFLTWFKVSLITFGGSAPLPLLRDELVAQRGILHDADFASALAIGLITPGPNGLFVIPIAYFVAGVPGALVAALSLCCVALTVLLLLWLHQYIAHRPATRAALRGIQAATLGLILTLGWTILVATIHGPLDLAIAVAAFALLSFTRVDVLWIVGGAAAIGLATHLAG
ncbi:MAG TPA: chromate transporter [Chloroflexota bacterium]|nr:chromate transporter [Chloroflexota bacterium]